MPPGSVTLLVRPEQLHVSAEGEPNAEVRSLRYFGHDALLDLALDTGVTALARLTAPVGTAPGSRVRVTVVGEVRAYARRED